MGKGAGELSSNQRVSMTKATALSGEGEWALESLLVALNGSLKWNEHAVMWAVIMALLQLVDHPVCRQQLLVAGFLPILRRARDTLRSAEGRLPLPLQQPKFAPVKVSRILRRLALVQR